MIIQRKGSQAESLAQHSCRCARTVCVVSQTSGLSTSFSGRKEVGGRERNSSGVSIG